MWAEKQAKGCSVKARGNPKPEGGRDFQIKSSIKKYTVKRQILFWDALPGVLYVSH